MSKTIKQIADEIGKTKQSVYKRYKGKLYTVVAPYTHTVDGTVYISEQGEKLIKQDFLGDTISNGVHTEAHTEVDTGHSGAYTEYIPNQTEKLLEDNQQQIEWLRLQLDKIQVDKQNEIDYLKEQLKQKDINYQKQLTVKDAQIEAYSNRLEQALNNQSQDNYIMAHRMIESAAISSGIKNENEIVDRSSDQAPNQEIKQTLWKKILGKYRNYSPVK